MTRTVSSNVTFDCDFVGCAVNAQTSGPLPDGWGELQLNEVVADAVVDEKTKQVVTPEQRANNVYHLCPAHVPKLEP